MIDIRCSVLLRIRHFSTLHRTILLHAVFCVNGIGQLDSAAL